MDDSFLEEEFSVGYRSKIGYVTNRNGSLVERLKDGFYPTADFRQNKSQAIHNRIKLKKTKKKVEKQKTISKRNLIRLLLLQQNNCFYCGNRATPMDSNLDHVVPKSKGGTSHFMNLVASHKKCNGEKGSAMPTGEQIKKLEELNRRKKKIRI